MRTRGDPAVSEMFIMLEVWGVQQRPSIMGLSETTGFINMGLLPNTFQ